MTAAAMTPGQLLAAFIVACIALTMLAVLFALGLGRAAARPMPKPPHLEDLWGDYFDGGAFPTLTDRMETARTWDPVEAAENITKEATR